MFVALQPLWNVRQCFDVRGDVFAFVTVAARCAGDECALLVTQRHRQPVDLRFGGERDLLIVGKPQKTADAADEVAHIVLAEGVVQRQHRHGMAHFGKARRRRGADALRQACRRAQLRKARFDRAVTLPQLVVFGVADGRCVFRVITLIVCGDLGLKPRVLGFGLCFGEVTRRNFGGIFNCHPADNPSFRVSGRQPETQTS